MRGILDRSDAPRPLAELLAAGARLRERLDTTRAVALLVGTNADAGRVAIRGEPDRSVALPAGSLVIALALLHDSVLLPTPPDRVLNRNVRGCLRGLGAQYFGSEHLVIAGSPVAWVGFERDAAGRVLVEVLVGVEQALATEPPSTMRGRAYASLRALGLDAATPELTGRIVAGHARFGVEFEPDLAEREPITS